MLSYQILFTDIDDTIIPVGGHIFFNVTKKRFPSTHSILLLPRFYLRMLSVCGSRTGSGILSNRQSAHTVKSPGRHKKSKECKKTAVLLPYRISKHSGLF